MTTNTTMNRLQTLALPFALLFAAACAPSLALAADRAQDPQSDAPVQVEARPDGRKIVHFNSMTRTRDGAVVFGMRAVRNAPYSASTVTERLQVLGDGNQISQRRDSATWYRDSAGRTRLETRDAQGELRSVTINDPVAGAGWTLDPRERTAFKVALRVRTEPETKAELAAHLATIVKRVERMDGEAQRRIREDVRIGMPGAPLASALSNALGDARWRKDAVSRDLGTRDIGGVKAQGRLRSYEIPAGAIGNRDAIVVSDETWYAPDLKVTVYTKHSDPRSGDTVFRLENVKREEPAAALFSVPADYTVKDALAKPARRSD